MGRNENDLGENDLWCTPPEVLDPIYKHFGGIGFDPFGSPAGIVEADTYITIHGVRMERACRKARRQANIIHGDAITEVAWPITDKPGFANGPFSICHQWVPKAYHEAQRGCEVILLLPTRTGSVYYQNYVSRSDALIFWKGRMKFLGAKYIAPFHCALSYFGPRPQLFAEAFPEHWLIKGG